MADPLPYKFHLTAQRAQILKENYSNFLVVADPGEDGLCEVHLRIDTGFDCLCLIQAGCMAGMQSMMTPVSQN